jgi:hypothetical protein
MSIINATVEVVGIAGSVVEVPISAQVGLQPINASVQPFTISASPGPILVLASVVVPAINVAVSGGTSQSEDDVAFAQRIDVISDLLIYRAEAVPGSLDAEAKWRIRRITIATDDDVTTEWADGVASFTKIWNDRLGLSYS